MEKEFIENAAKCGVTIDDAKMDLLREFYEILIEVNQSMNLTAITEYEEVLSKHFLDSLLIVQALQGSGFEAFFDTPSGSRIADIGTGAGFPGIPLKIAFPEVDITLIDSLNKRIKFIREACEKIGITGIEAVHGRSEELGRNKKYRQGFDMVVSRAVAALPVLAEYCIPFVKKGGVFVSYKAQGVQDEVKDAGNAIEKLGGRLLDVREVPLEGTDIVRSFIIIEKIKDTPKEYPRKAGTPAKMPL